MKFLKLFGYFHRSDCKECIRIHRFLKDNKN